MKRVKYINGETKNRTYRTVVTVEGQEEELV